MSNPELDIAGPQGNPGASNRVWRIVANNKKVAEGWRYLCDKILENMVRCFEHLSEDPMRSIPRKCFKLKGRKFDGCWEYEVSGGDRIFYKPDATTTTVLIYYAGPHPRSKPEPPR